MMEFVAAPQVVACSRNLPGARPMPMIRRSGAMPTPRPHFDAPPLVEAVFDCFVEPSELAPGLEELDREFFKAFPTFEGKKQDWRRFEARFEVQRGQPSQSLAMHPAGVRRWNKEHTRGVLVGPGVLALNVLPPYGEFEDHAPQLRALLDAYLGTAKPLRIDWLGHRYINQVEISLTDKETAADLFHVYPAALHAQASLHRPITVQLESSQFPNGIVMTTFALSALNAEKAIYSLDVYGRTTGPVAASPAEIMDWHFVAHDAVVNAFLASITPTARRRFKERSS
jgi:uncharacterized protein (TIGR04255 family)